MKLRKGTTKYILRRATRGLIPPLVLQRHDKAAAEYFIRGVVATHLGKLSKWLKTKNARELFDGEALLDDIKCWLEGGKWFPIPIESALSLLHWMMCRPG
jgi:hypothetical protein